jgi:hypothetical protein
MSTPLLAQPEHPTKAEPFALALLLATTAATLLGVPLDSWRASAADPCHLAALAALATTATLTVTRHLGARAFPIERTLLALFLAGMPLVYVGSWVWASEAHRTTAWLVVEICGVPIYGTLAFVGLRRAPIFLVLGIAAHGLLWDAWHIGRSAYVPDWYAVGCLVMDVSLAVYLAVRTKRWLRV